MEPILAQDSGPLNRHDVSPKGTMREFAEATIGESAGASFGARRERDGPSDGPGFNFAPG